MLNEINLSDLNRSFILASSLKQICISSSSTLLQIPIFFTCLPPPPQRSAISQNPIHLSTTTLLDFRRIFIAVFPGLRGVNEASLCSVRLGCGFLLLASDDHLKCFSFHFQLKIKAFYFNLNSIHSYITYIYIYIYIYI